MSETLPLFPLGTVLYPGLLLPLHIFEDRYRQLVRDLLDGPEPRRFGVIAIRKGRETGVEGISSLYEIGCTATLRRVAERDDGGFDLVTVGPPRVRLLGAWEAGAVRRGFRGYLDALTARGATQVSIPDLPADPLLLSYLVAASVIIDLSDRQALLAEPDAAARLAAERALLSRETTMLRSLTSTPAPDLRYSPYNPN